MDLPLNTVFLLSPARLDGRRAQMLFEPKTPFPLATALRTREGAPIGEVFRFCSGLYFRGKLAYATAFARPPASAEAAWLGSGALVITQNRGLIPAETRVCLEHLEAFAATDISPTSRDFRAPLERDARALEDVMREGAEGRVVLLGSIASDKYVAPLLATLGERLDFPSAFVGKGDMTRGSMMLTAAATSTELAYTPLSGAKRSAAR